MGAKSRPIEDELATILDRHRAWLMGKEGGVRADLGGADMRGAEGYALALARMSICPEGALVGWKKCLLADGTPCVVKLRIPEDAARSNATGRKCRASKAEVLEVQTMGGEPIDAVAHSRHDPAFGYAAGSTVEPTSPFCSDRMVECASGIHFFITREEAVIY